MLISCTGVQMLIWPEQFCEALAGLGFHVTRFDNRDAGLSTHLTEASSSGWFKNLIRPSAEMLSDMGRRAYDRNPGDPRADARQRAAVSASGDRRGELGSVRVPTLVIHGEDDPITRPKAGRATAAAIPDARLVTYRGMGHDLPKPLWPSFLEEIQKLTRAHAPASAPGPRTDIR